MSPLFKLPTLDYLKANCEKIHFFGLGFIQIKMKGQYRFHFYTSKMESIMPVEEVHNHRYDFCSYVLKGSLRHWMYRFEPGSTHEQWLVACESGKDSVRMPDTGTLKLTLEQTLEAGSHYRIPHFAYHQVQSDFAITKVVPGPRLMEYASVIQKVGAKSVCPFSKVAKEDTLWEVVEELLGGS